MAVAGHQDRPIGGGSLKNGATPFTRVHTHGGGCVFPIGHPLWPELGQTKNEEAARGTLLPGCDGKAVLMPVPRAVSLTTYQRKIGVSTEHIAVPEIRPVVQPVTGVLHRIALCLTFAI